MQADIPFDAKLDGTFSLKSFATSAINLDRPAYKYFLPYSRFPQ